MKPKTAIIGAGVGGLTAGYFLNATHNITVFEKTERIGGNAYMIETPEGQKIDIAVAAFGKAGYAEFYALLEELEIETNLSANTYMSFHNLDSGEGLYLTPNLKAGLKQSFDFVKPKTLKVLYDLYIGMKESQQLFDKGKLAGLTMRDLMGLVPRLSGDAQRILICTFCLLSSMSAEDIMNTPAEFFMRKLKVHDDVISPRSLYSVRTVNGGTQAYIEALVKKYKKKIVFKSKIKSVLRDGTSVTLVMSDGKKEKFDHVIFACNADQALKLLDKPTKAEKKLLGVWSYNEGRIVVHKDHSSFPSKELIQAYTFLYTEKKKKLQTSVNGALWFEPQVEGFCDYISSQYPNFPIRKELILFDKKLRTPKFSFDAIKALADMPTLNGTLNTYYCGSHFGFGLHNDAVKSAIAVAGCFGIKGPYICETKLGRSLKGLLDIAGKLKRS